MQKHSDEALVAYLDGELDPTERGHVEAWLDADPAGRERLSALVQSGDLVRGAYAETLDEAVPDRLIAAARGETAAAAREAEILVLPPRLGGVAHLPLRHWSIGLAAAAGLFGLVFGGVGTYLGMGLVNPADPGIERQAAAKATDEIWLNNAA